MFNIAIEAFVDYIVDVINVDNTHSNAIVYGGEFPNEVIVTFENKTKASRDHYNMAVIKAIELGGIIKSTHPGNMVTTVKFTRESVDAGTYFEGNDLSGSYRRSRSGRTTVYLARTNAYDCLIAINHEDRIARCLIESDTCTLCKPSEVEDASSWDEADYDAIAAELELPINCQAFEIIDLHTFPYSANIMM